MKKLLYLLLILPLLVSCSKDDDNELSRDYTSIVVKMDDYSLRDIKLACKKDGVFIKLAYIGKLEFNEHSKEIRIDNNISEVYIFGSVGLFRLRNKDSFILNKNLNNTLLIGSNTSIFIDVEDIKDPTQYPQD